MRLHAGKTKKVNYRKAIIRIILMLCIAAILWPVQLQAQRRDRMPRFQNLLEHDVKRYHFGFSVGFNSLDFAIRPSDEQDFKHVLSEPTSSAGFAGGYHVGIIGNLKLGRYFDLRFVPTYIYSHDREIEFYDDAYNELAPDSYQTLEINMIQFPLLLKYKSARMNNTRAYVIGGISYSYDLDAASARSAETGPPGNQPFRIKVGHHDLQYEAGIGIEQYFPLFKGSIELKASFGLMNLLREGTDPNPAYYDAIYRMHSRSIMLSFIFEG